MTEARSSRSWVGFDLGGTKMMAAAHMPRSEAVTSRGEMFCSREHLQLADRESRGR